MNVSEDDKKIVIVDTDPGIDDAMALFLLKQAKELEIKAITTVFGNGPVETTTRNAAYIVDRFGFRMPVVQGAAGPLRGARFVPDLLVHGQDGFGGTNVSIEHPLPQSGQDAASFIAEMVRRYPKRVSVLALAPLTNLALALERDPEIAGLVDEIVLMGGAFACGGNITPYAEANIYYDPHAAAHVFGAAWPITAVGLDVTRRCILSTADAQALASSGGDAGAFLWSISRDYERIYRQLDGVSGCCIHDVTAAAYLIDPSLFQTKTGQISVQTEGSELGKTDFEPDSDELKSRHKICVDLNVERVVSAYISAVEQAQTTSQAARSRKKAVKG